MTAVVVGGLGRGALLMALKAVRRDGAVELRQVRRMLAEAARRVMFSNWVIGTVDAPRQKRCIRRKGCGEATAAGSGLPAIVKFYDNIRAWGQITIYRSAATVFVILAYARIPSRNSPQR